MAMIDKEIQLLMLKGEKGDPGIAGDYNELTNKPKINGVELLGNKTASDLGLASEADLNAAVADIATNAANIGTLSNLTTTDKSSLVAAINEVNADTFSKNAEYGTWSPVPVTVRGEPVPHTLSTSTYTQTRGDYYRVGSLVYVTFTMYVTSIDVSGFTNPPQAGVGGLPYPADPGVLLDGNRLFTVGAGRNATATGFLSDLNIWRAVTSQFADPSTVVYLLPTQSNSNVTWLDMPASGSWGGVVYGSGIYYATI